MNNIGLLIYYYIILYSKYTTNNNIHNDNFIEFFSDLRHMMYLFKTLIG